MSSEHCLVLLKEIEPNKKEIAIFLTKEDFNNLEKIDNILEYTDNINKDLLIFFHNYEKLNDQFKKQTLFKLSSFINKINVTLNCSINCIQFNFYKNKIHINYDISSLHEINF